MHQEIYIVLEEKLLFVQEFHTVSSPFVIIYYNHLDAFLFSHFIDSSSEEEDSDEEEESSEEDDSDDDDEESEDDNQVVVAANQPNQGQQK